MKMNSITIAAWALGVAGVAMFAAGLILTKTRKPSGPQWHDAPEMGDYTVVGNTVYEVPAGQIPVRQKDGSIVWEGPSEDTAPADTPPKLGPNEVVTTDSNPTPLTGNFVVPYKLVFAASSGIRWNSIEDAAREQGKHVITQAEAEEVVKLLSDHAGNLESFLEQLRQEQRADDATKISTDMGAAKAALAKWRKRVEEGKP